MKFTRIVALAIISGSAGLVIDHSALEAQTTRAASPPAEYPPASYAGKQYVDSRGCVYIRAGIDGNVNWVPRVARNRKQLCGYKPTPVAGSTRQPNQNAAPERITLDGPSAPATSQTTAAAPVATTPAPAKPAPKPRRPAAAAAPVVVTTAKPQRTPETTTARVTPAPAPRRATVPVSVRPAPVPQPVAPASAPAQQVTTGQGHCPGASAISQQYINQGTARCGPQAQSPVTYGNGSGIGPQSNLTPNTRVLPVHVYQERRHSQDLTPPAGYKPVWQDDRLNLRRAERDLRPAILTSQTHVPAGYVPVERDDDRLNPYRGERTARGDAQMAEVWTDGTPRRLRSLPLDRPVVTGPSARHDSYEGRSANGALALRLSTRSAPGAEAATSQTNALAERTAAQPARYVRAATFADPAEAQRAARALAAKGLPVRLGAVSRQGKPYKVVLAGPFPNLQAAEQAQAQVQAAGYRGARISR